MASITFELECEVEGVVSRYEEGTCVDNLDLTSVSMLVVDVVPGKHFNLVTRNVDLLDGLNKEARNQIIANILAAFSEEAADAVMGDQ